MKTPPTNTPPQLSPAAFAKLTEELESLVNDGRQKMSERLLAARELGDISENSEYETAKNDQGLMEARINELQQILDVAVVREAPAAGDVVVEGMIVSIKDVDDPDFTDTLLVADSAERASGARVVSPASPLGAALLGHRVGEVVEYQAPRGVCHFEITDLKPAE